jgi:hypothetical protein
MRKGESSNFAWNSDVDKFDEEEDDCFETFKKDSLLIISAVKSMRKRLH